MTIESYRAFSWWVFVCFFISLLIVSHCNTFNSCGCVIKWAILHTVPCCLPVFHSITPPGLMRNAPKQSAVHCVHQCVDILCWILIQDTSGQSRSLSRTEFINLACSSVGRGSREEYGLLFDSVVVTQEHRGLLLDSDAVKEEGRVDWGGLCSFLLLELSDKVKINRTTCSSVPCWKPPRTLTCPHRDPVQKVIGHWPQGESQRSV